jgi:Ca2+:H+ antiporter
MSLVFSLRTHKHLYLEEVGKVEARWSLKYSLLVLCTSTAAVALMSNSLVSSVEPLVESWGWSQLFIGVIVIALIGNAAEHYSAVVVALKNRMDLSLQIAIGSAMQIPMVVAPLLLLASLLLPVHMNLVFDTFELICIVLSVSIVNLVIADGESNWLEGLQLVAAYAIVAVSFFFHP